MTDADLGDPKVPQPGDPTEITLTLDARVLQAVVVALNELPGKISHRALTSVEAQVDAAVRAARRAAKEQAQQQPPAPPPAMNRHERRAARHAKPPAVNGSAAAPEK